MWHDEKKKREAKDGEYEVKSIVGKRVAKKGVTEYKVRWAGYGEGDDTWEPLQTLHSVKGHKITSLPWWCVSTVRQRLVTWSSASVDHSMHQPTAPLCRLMWLLQSRAGIHLHKL